MKKQAIKKLGDQLIRRSRRGALTESKARLWDPTDPLLWEAVKMMVECPYVKGDPEWDDYETALQARFYACCCGNYKRSLEMRRLFSAVIINMLK